MPTSRANRYIKISILIAGILAGSGPAGARIVTDMSDARIAVPDQVNRIGCLDVLCYEKLFLLGAVDRVAMMVRTNAPWMRVTNPRLDDILQLDSEPNPEDLLRRRVDVVMRATGYPAPGKVDILTQAGIPVLVSQPMTSGLVTDIDGFVAARDRMMRLFAQVLGPDFSRRAEDWCRYHDRWVALVRDRVRDIPADRRIRVYHMRGPAPTQSSGASSNIHWYATIAGADMVTARSLPAGRGEISPEQLQLWDPQVITVGRQYPADAITGDPAFAAISAVRDHRVIEIPDGVFFWDGSSEGVLFMLFMAKTLYPDRFTDIDLKAEVKAYYAQFYRHALTDAQVELMLSGKGPDGRRHNSMGN